MILDKISESSFLIFFDVEKEKAHEYHKIIKSEFGNGFFPSFDFTYAKYGTGLCYKFITKNNRKVFWTWGNLNGYYHENLPIFKLSSLCDYKSYHSYWEYYYNTRKEEALINELNVLNFSKHIENNNIKDIDIRISIIERILSKRKDENHI